METEVIDRDKTFADIEFIKEAINDGWYVIVYINRDFIMEPGVPPGCHEIMIYGYDDTENRLIYCDHDRTGRYALELSCDYESYLCAYASVTDLAKAPEGFYFKNYISKLRPKTCTSYELDLIKVSDSLKTYLNLEKCEHEVLMGNGGYYGQKIYDHMIQYFNNLDNGISAFSIHMGSCAVLCDHKKLVAELLKKLDKMHLIPAEANISYKSVVYGTVSLRNLVLKYNITKNKILLKTICDLIKKIRSTEYDILLSILRHIGKLT